MSSDSSDDEIANKLREAMDSDFIHDKMFNGTLTKSTLNLNNQPSLRPNINKDDQFNQLGVTPQFQQYVAKQLSSVLDAKLQQLNRVEDMPQPRKRHKGGGIKLFRASTTKIKRIGKTDEPTKHKVIIDKYDEHDNEVKCSEVAVNPNDILSKKDVKNWSVRSKAPIYKYKICKNGILKSTTDT